MDSSKPLTDIHHTLLLCMYDHFVSCDSLTCLFPWCCPQLRLYLPTKATKEEAITHLKQWIASSFVEANPVPGISLQNFIKFDQHIEFDCAPREGQAWVSLCMMGKFSKARLVKPQSPFATESNQYWVLKRPLNDNMVAAWEVYLQLAQLKNLSSVTPLLWAARLTDSTRDFIVCSALEGVCLHEYLQCNEPLTSDFVVKIMMKLSVALGHLQTMNIVYLNWTTKNILVQKDLRGDLSVKLINFDASTIVGQVMDMSALPVHLLPPEVLCRKPVTLSSDLWGMGCVLYELTTLRPVWHEKRHLPIPELQDMMKTYHHPRPPDVHWSLRPLYTLCWEVDPSKRVDVVRFYILLSQY
ncbi:serine/threonine-protein kinase Nek8 [Elysia marginata]|uniref:Serine/threonine-protein kinase Nek8 n=1 Tax=Elysia marginata TaxID=1093978 RepID=A0AAV4I7B2_9GAST|nr:serine/threonine-protein kinase Nek8 [Elysia marginata]